MVWNNVGDFWNDPRRWDGIEDPHREMFWMKRRADVIDVRRPRQSIANPYQNTALGALSQLGSLQAQSVNLDDLLNARPGSLIRYDPRSSRAGWWGKA